MNKLLLMKVLAKIVTLASLLSASVVFAQSEEYISDTEGHPLISGFPDSELVEVVFESDVNYRMVLGTLQRTRGVVAPEDSERLRGDLSKLTYEVSQEFGGADVYQYFREQMAERGYSELFACEGRACGSSNYWANDIFRNRVLYGPERNQYFIAMRSSADAESAVRIALYIITRGNRDIYAYLEILEPGGTQYQVELRGDNDLLDNLREEGSIVLPAVFFDNEDQLTEASDLTALIELLQADTSTRIYLVAHLAGSDTLDILLERSTARAEAVRLGLLSAGISPTRIEARGLGPLSPQCAADNCGERVEVVLQPVPTPAVEIP